MAPKAWYSRLSFKLHQLGFSSSKANTSLFYYRKGDTTIFILVYVDDIIVISSTSQAVEALLRDLRTDFAFKDLGELNYFLGIEVKRARDGIVLSQQKYASYIIKRVGTEHCKYLSTPMSILEKLLIETRIS